MTRDLRRRALESNKTLSKKAQARLSGTSSAANSRAGSRTVSRNPSDDEDGELSDSSTVWSTNSIDDLLSAELPEDSTQQWTQDIGDRIEEIIDRKRSSVQGRELALAKYAHILICHYACEEIEGKESELIPAFVKSIKSGDSDRETSLALRAIGLTLITNPSETIYDVVYQVIKRAYYDGSPAVKVTAIHTLSAAAIYGGAADSEIEEIMDEYIEIIESDGESVGAADNADVVEAACEAWGFLATYIDDIRERTEAAMDAFVDQLDSGDVSVQLAAGETIALLYEKSYTPREADDEPPSRVEDDAGNKIDNSMVSRYVVYRQINQLIEKVESLSSESSRSIAKKDRKALHTSFNDILNTIHNPTQGPRYSKAIDQETGKAFGSRLTYKLSGNRVVEIKQWWILHRLQAMKRFLGGGFRTHYESNPSVFENLPCKTRYDCSRMKSKSREAPLSNKMMRILEDQRQSAKTTRNDIETLIQSAEARHAKRINDNRRI